LPLKQATLVDECGYASGTDEVLEALLDPQVARVLGSPRRPTRAEATAL
jgi:hypothetical protein